MPRIARAVAIGFRHHVTQRGIIRDAFFEDLDILSYEYG